MSRLMFDRWLLSAVLATGLCSNAALGQNAGDIATPATPSTAASAGGTGTGAAHEPVTPASVEKNGPQPGAMLEARKLLFDRLMQAKQEGIGIVPYMAAFARIEQNAQAGHSQEQLQPQIESLARSLKDQLQRSQILKTQRPIPPAASQQQGGAPGTADAAAAPAKKDTTASILEKLKEKITAGDIPDSLKEHLNTEKGKKILERLTGQ